MLTCKDVATAITQDESRTGSWRRRLALRFHSSMCTHCRRYAAQIRAIGAAARNLARAHGEDPAALERLQRRSLGRCDTSPAPARSSNELADAVSSDPPVSSV